MSMSDEIKHLKNGELMVVFRHIAGDDIADVAGQVLQILSGSESAFESAQSKPMLHRSGQEIQAASFIINSARTVYEASTVADRFMSAMHHPFRVSQEFPHGEGGYILIDHDTIPAPGLG